MNRIALHVLVTLSLVAGGILIAVSSCEQPASEARKVVRIALDQIPTNLDPVRSSQIYQGHLVVNLYDTLYSYKLLARPYELKPRLATGSPTVSDDGLSYTIRIRQGVYFIDDPSFEGGIGRELVASDVVYSLQRHFDPASLSTGSWFWSGRIAGLDAWKDNGANYDEPVDGLKALDRYTVQITLTQPYPQLVHTLAHSYAAIVPREAVEFYGSEFGTHPVGSGPFVLQSFDSTRAVLEKNPTFRQEPVDIRYEGYRPDIHSRFDLEKIDGRIPPFVDQLSVEFIVEDIARVVSLEKDDEVHIARIGARNYDRVFSQITPLSIKPDYEDRFHYLTNLESGFVYRNFNMLDPDFGYHEDSVQNEKNKALRCAIIKGFDWSDRNSRYYSGLGQVFPGVIPPIVPEFDPALDSSSVEYDVEEAKRLLSDSGWTADNLPVLTYGIANSTLEQQFFEQFRGFMIKIGYPQEKIVIKRYATFGDIAGAWSRSELPLINKGWALDYPDAENTLQLFYGPNHSPGSNDSNYANPEYDRIFKQASTLQPGPERTALYRRLNRMIIDDCLAITGMSRTEVLMWDKRVIAYPDRSFVGGFHFPYIDISTGK